MKCIYCGLRTSPGDDRCDRCWEIETRLTFIDFEVLRKICLAKKLIILKQEDKG